jgi:hypothetical protein
MDEKMHRLVRWLNGPIDGCLDEWVDGWPWINKKCFNACDLHAKPQP